MTAFALALVLVLAMLAAALAKRSGTLRTDEVPEFALSKPLTNIEQALYWRLVEALPDEIIIAQVQLTRFLRISQGRNHQAWFNKISRKSVDFLVCKRDFSVLAAIELDDASHGKPKRQKSDFDKSIAIAKAGVPLIRWQARKIPDASEIKAAFGQLKQ